MKREEPTDALEGDDLGKGRAPIGVLLNQEEMSDVVILKL